MTKFVLAYQGGGGMPETEAEQAEVMAQWGAWFGQLGEAVVDGGAPFGDRRVVQPDGSTSPAAASQLSGYSILQADSIDAALDLAKGCPVLQGGGTVDVYEAIEM